jgi:hypothetical protein
MKVHSLSIDSSEHAVIIDEYSNTFQSPHDYIVTLENPIYDVSSIKLVSARIPTPQLTTCSTNKSFSIDGNVFTLEETNYANGYVLAEDVETLVAPPDSNVSLVVYDEETNTLNFSNVGTSNTFTLEFFSGTNGHQSDASTETTPHQILGFGSRDYTGSSIKSGSINLEGPNSLILKLTAGSDELNQDVYSSTPFYTGHLLLDGSAYINFNGADDHLEHRFHSGPQKYIRDIRVEFFYMSHGRLIPYDFRNQDHILKFEITCSTDKLANLPKVPIDEEKAPISISVPKEEEKKDVYVWIYIAAIILIGLLMMLFTKRKPKFTG